MQAKLKYGVKNGVKTQEWWSDTIGSFSAMKWFVFINCANGKKSVQTEEKNSKKPNIVLINVDDLGWKDLGYMGSTYYETSNVDKLAAEGMVFTNAYAGAANCAPSRACLISGLNTPRHGVYTVSPSDRGDSRTRKNKHFTILTLR